MSITDMIVVMKSGVIQQTGRPQDVYDDPTNLFVAKFLGTPAINVFSGEIRDGAVFVGGDRIASCPGEADRTVYVAVRPEGLMPDEGGSLHVRVTSTEVMGRDSSIVFTHPCGEESVMRAIVDSSVVKKVVPGEAVFALREDKVFVFDGMAEERIRGISL